MWTPWAHNSTVRIHDRPSYSPKSPFSCSSFKDIQYLCNSDETPPPSSIFAGKKLPAVFHRVRVANLLLRGWQSRPPPESLPSSISLPGSESRIVVYFTSLRVVRSTFEDCKAVRSILRSFRVSIDERDLSMDCRFLNELQGILGQRKLILPRVFIGGRYVGGADEIRQLNEVGELKKFVEGLPAADSAVCDACGGYRFILCDECNGSHKLYTEKTGFKTCMACNENGLIRCSSCSCAPF